MAMSVYVLVSAPVIPLKLPDQAPCLFLLTSSHVHRDQPAVDLSSRTRSSLAKIRIAG